MQNTKDSIQDIYNLAEDAFRTELLIKAVALFKKVEELAQEVGDANFQLKALEMRGTCLIQSGKIDLGLACLLEVSSCRLPDVDPSVVFLATTGAIRFSRLYKEVNLAYKLLQEAEDYLREIRKTDWMHMLNAIHANLEIERGNYKVAYDLGLEGWQRVQSAKDKSVQYSPSVYLWILVRSAFYLRNMSELRNWTKFITQCDKHFVLDKISAQTSSLLLFCAEWDEHVKVNAVTDLTIDTLRLIATSDSPHGDVYWDQLSICHHCLLLCEQWEIVKQFSNLFSATGQYRWLVFQADTEYAKTRQILGFVTWDNRLASGVPIQKIRSEDSNVATISLDKAINYLKQARPFAEAEDKRLECTIQMGRLNVKLEQIRQLQTWMLKM